MKPLDKNFFTYEDYKNWEGRWELIDGKAYDMSPAPYPRHQRVILKIAKIMMDSFECKNCEVYISPIDWKLDNINVVQPDIAIFCEDPKEQYFSKTPPLIVEPNSEVVDIFELTNSKYELKSKLTNDKSYKFTFDDCKVSIDFKKVFA